MTAVLSRQAGATLSAADPIGELDVMIAKALKAGANYEYGLRHEFTPGLYSRTVLLRKGDIVTSRVHKTDHQYVVSKGVLQVYTPENGIRVIVAPYIGTTKAGQRRAVYVLEDAVWTTFHATTAQSVAEVEKELFG